MKKIIMTIVMASVMFVHSSAYADSFLYKLAGGSYYSAFETIIHDAHSFYMAKDKDAFLSVRENDFVKSVFEDRNIVIRDLNKEYSTILFRFVGDSRWYYTHVVFIRERGE